MKNRIGFIEAQTEISACAGEQLKNWKESKVNPLAEEEERALIERLTRITSLSTKAPPSMPLQAEPRESEQSETPETPEKAETPEKSETPETPEAQAHWQEPVLRRVDTQSDEGGG